MIPGTGKGAKLWIAGDPVIDGFKVSGQLGTRGATYIQAGLHPYKFEIAGEPGRRRFTWMYPDGKPVVDIEHPDALENELPLRMYRPLPTQLFYAAK